jgi:hypothetical protein
LAAYDSRITTTADEELRLADPLAYQSWEIIEPVLRRRLGPVFATFLAEPVPESGRGLTHWRVALEGAAAPLAGLASADRVRIRAELAARRNRVLALAGEIEASGQRPDRALAAALRQAMSVPDEERFVWSIGGQPVLVAWGHEYHRESRPTAMLIGLTGGSPGDSGVVPFPAPLPATASESMRTAPAAPASRVGVWTVLGWALFVALLAIIGARLLVACGMTLFGVSLGLCPGGPVMVAEADPEAERSASLMALIRQAEMDLAARAIACAEQPSPVPPRADAPPPASPRVAAPAVPPSVVRPTPDSLITRPASPPDVLRRTPAAPDETIVRRRVAGGGVAGPMNISLTWNTRDDLDLYVRCPGGQINYVQRQACGGSLQIDVNAGGDTTDQPVEDVVWSTAPPPGEYEITVHLYSPRASQDAPVPFTIQITREGQPTQAFDGFVSRARREVLVHRFSL